MHDPNTPCTLCGATPTRPYIYGIRCEKCKPGAKKEEK